MSATYDVVVVGGRCAGSALARLTAGAGLRTLVIDRAEFPSDTVSTHSISAHGTELLHRWGLLDDVLATGAPNPHHIRVTIGAFDMRLPLPESGHGFLAPRRIALDQLLVDAARRAGADVWEATTVTGLEEHDRAVRGLRCRRPDGTMATVNATMVVGADGSNSAVARAVDAPAYAIRPSNDDGVYAYYEDTGLDVPQAGLAERKLALAFPTNDQQVCIAAGGHTRDFSVLHAGGERALADVADQVAPGIGEALRRGRRASRFVVFKAQPGKYRYPYGDGWALVGDAGHYSDPFTGQGIANAFLGAHLLGIALVDGLGGACTLADALNDYHRQRDELTGEIHQITHDLAAFDWDEAAGAELFLTWRALGDRLQEQVAALPLPATIAAADVA